MWGMSSRISCPSSLNEPLWFPSYTRMTANIVSTGLFLALALVLPGYLVVSGFTNSQVSGAGLETIEALFLSIVLSSALTGIVGLVLAQVGWFSLPALLIVLLLISFAVAGVVWMKRRTLSWHVTSSSRIEWLTVSLIVLGAAMLFLHPHQYVFGGGDAGVYVNVGANLAQTGALLIEEPLLTEIKADLLPGLLREQYPGAATRFIRLPGFYLSDTVPGLVIPQFYPLHPVWLGIGYRLLGVSGALSVTPVWAIFSVVAIYLYGRSLFGQRTGWLAALLLLIMPLQVYFARYPTAEPITQFLIWTCVWAFTAFGRGRAPCGLWRLVSGLTLGQVFLARVDALPLLLIPLGYGFVLLKRRQWSKSEWWFWLPLTSLIGYAFFHGLVFSRPYTVGLYRWIFPFFWRQFRLLVVVCVLGGALGFWLLKRRQWWVDSRVRHLPWGLILRYGAAVTVVGLAIYAYFVRPQMGNASLKADWYGGSQVVVTDHENLVRLGWYWSPLGIGLAVFGGVLLLCNERWSQSWPLWITGGAFTLLYVYRIFNNPFQIYAMRRYVPVVVPFFVLASAYAVSWLWKRAGHQKIGRLVGVALLVVLVAWLVWNGRMIWSQVDYVGAVEKIAHLAGVFEHRAIVLFVDEAPVGLGAVLGTPLQYLYGMTAFDLQEDRLDVDLLGEQVADWIRAGRPVYVVKNQASSSPLPLKECLVSAGSVQLDTPRLEQTYAHAPSAVQHVRYEGEIYWVEPACQLRRE